MHLRITVDLDRQLLERAKGALEAKTYREAITRALEEAVAGSELRALVRRIEGSDLTWDVDELLAYRRASLGDRS